MRNNSDIYVYTFNKDIEFDILNISHYSSIVSSCERELLATFIADKCGVFNGSTVSLINIDSLLHKDILNLAESDFYELLITNILFMNKDAILNRAKENDNQIIMNLINRMDKQFIKLKEFDTINSKIMSNSIAISILLEDIDGELLLVERANNMVIGSGLLSTTATGALDKTDLFSLNPIFHCAQRELQEELNIRATDMIIDSIVIAKNKLQPIFIVYGKYDRTFRDSISNIVKAKDYQAEVNKLIIISKKLVSNFIKDKQMTGATRFQIMNYIKNDGACHLG